MKKTILITGATSGFGRATAEKFAAADYNVIITGRRAEKLETLKASLMQVYNVAVCALCFDVQDRSSVFAAIASLPEEFKTINILVNNAGLALGREPFDEAEIDDWDTMMHTNVDGLLYVSRAVLPLLKMNKGAHIINIGSTASKEVYENGNVYCASKFAVDAITKAMRVDLLKHAIKVTGIYPGAANTEFSNVRFKGNDEKAADTYKGFEPLHAADVADAIFYCATLPPNVCINELVITCLAQASSYYIHKSN